VTSAVLELTGAEAGTDFGSKYVVKVLAHDVMVMGDLDFSAHERNSRNSCRPHSCEIIGRLRESAQC
jgi:hypothetical protein